MYLDKQHYKIRLQKVYLNAITTALTKLYFHSNKLNAATFVHLKILKKLNKVRFLFVSLPAYQQQLT